MALAETEVVAETKKWLEDEGIELQALRKAAGAELSTNVPGRSSGSYERSDKILLIKNLPFEAEVADLRRMFGKFGELGRLVMPPR